MDLICLPVIAKVLRLQIFNMQHVLAIAGCHQVAVCGLDGEGVAEPQHLIVREEENKQSRGQMSIWIFHSGIRVNVWISFICHLPLIRNHPTLSSIF